ncbi:DUF2955 domain-containing protein [Sphingomonas sp. RB56-2]|uniref:DUF2955 domain-containing protein n=1 Tax=Sphingomonas brevis TaxID=2908206 RepID=A0ABT0SA71_9SPHN|nr:DUF2955 domain-containing protein [Sphingomonas brevis]MCL6741304.1 DUF2955 domain-containing protein [Sphingomonas brevis]
MASAAAPKPSGLELAEAARTHFILRFSIGTTAAYIICQWMGWQPSALAPVLTGVLLANLPFSPPFKLGLGLVIVMAVSAWLSFFLTTFLSQVPHLLFGSIGLILFLIFYGLAQAKAQLPLTLLLICITVVPVMTLTVSEFAGMFPAILVRAMLLAVIFTWIAHAIWPLPSPKSPDPPPLGFASPAAAAALGMLIVLPMMLGFLMFGLTDAIPVLLTTALLVAKMEEERSSASAWAKLIGNFVGGIIAIAAFYLLAIAPTLTTLSLITFLIGIGFALEIAKGGVRGGNALIAYNATMVIFDLAILKGPANSGTWGARLVQFVIACIFATGMIALLWPRLKAKARHAGN